MLFVVVESSGGTYVAKLVTIIPLKGNIVSDKNFKPCSLNFVTLGLL